jgi:hypothetical protein
VPRGWHDPRWFRLAVKYIEKVRDGMRRHRWVRPALIGVGALVAVAVLVRLLLDPVATRATRKGLDDLKGFRGDFERVHVTLFGPGYTITRLKLTEEPVPKGKAEKAPVFYAERVHVGVAWRQLLHGRLVASARVVEPKISIIERGEKPKKDEPKRAPDLSRQLREVIPFELARLEIVRGELVYRDLTAPRHPEVWVHRLEAAAENLPTRAEMAEGRPTTLSASGAVGKSGALTMFVTADPFASPLEFGGRFELRGLRVAELHDFIAPKTELQAPKGTLDLFAEFQSKDGRIRGGVKPVLKNVEVRAAKPGFLAKVKAWFADEAVETASDRVPGRNAIAGVVPIQGRLAEPDIQLWPAVFGVVRNAFVEGIASGFAHVPPEVAERKQGVVEQAKEALEKDEGPPKAQPTKEGRP